MAVTREQIRSRIIAAVKAITPTRPGEKFRFVGDDDMAVEDQVAAGNQERSFEVFLFGTGQKGNIQLPGASEFIQTFLVKVVYPAKFSITEMEAMASDDQEDIMRALDDSANWGTDVYYQASHELPEAARIALQGGDLDRYVLGVPVVVDFLTYS